MLKVGGNDFLRTMKCFADVDAIELKGGDL